MGTMRFVPLESLEHQPIPRLPLDRVADGIAQVANGECIGFISSAAADTATAPYDEVFASHYFFRTLPSADLDTTPENEFWHTDEQSYPNQRPPVNRIHDHITWSGSLTVSLIRQRHGLETIPDGAFDRLTAGMLDTEHFEPVVHTSDIHTEERLIFAVTGRQAIAHYFRSHPGKQRESMLTIYDQSSDPGLL